MHYVVQVEFILYCLAGMFPVIQQVPQVAHELDYERCVYVQLSSVDRFNLPE